MCDSEKGDSVQSKPLSQTPIKTYEADQLNMKPHVRALADTLRWLEPGSVVSVFGDWGQGKTSFLNMLRDYISISREFAKFEPIWVPLWHYEKALDVAYRFARDVKEQTISVGGRVLRRVKVHGEEAFSALSILVRSIKVKLGADGAGAELDVDTSREEIIRLTEEIRKKHWLAYDEEEQLRKRLRELLGTSHGKEPIVFIDDLDRCEPETALCIIEDLKLILMDTGCRFVLAIDQGVLRSAVLARFRRRDFVDPEQQTGSYVDKFIDLSISLPRMSVEDARRFLAGLAEDHKEFTGLTEAERFTLLAGIPLNPRAIKRFLATLHYGKKAEEGIQQERAEGEKTPPESATSATHEPRLPEAISQAARVKRLILELFYPQVMDFARKHPAEFRELQMPVGELHPEWPRGVSPEAVREAKWDYLEDTRVQAALTDEEARALIPYVRKYCPHLFSFLKHTPPITSDGALIRGGTADHETWS